MFVHSDGSTEQTPVNVGAQCAGPPVGFEHCAPTIHFYRPLNTGVSRTHHEAIAPVIEPGATLFLRDKSDRTDTRTLYRLIPLEARSRFQSTPP